MSIAVYDIDGVVADVRHRVHHVEQRPKDWDRFFDGAVDDPALAEGIELVHASQAAGHQIVWLTGRPEWLRAITTEWLAAHGLPAGTLLMRDWQDYRPARFMKLAKLRKLDRGDIVSFVDDDPDVIDVALAAGFPAVLATWIPRSSALADAQERAGRS